MNPMKSSIRKILNKKASPDVVNGKDGFLTIIEAPTGMGKTYELACLAIDYLIANEGKHFLYVTTVNSNVDDFVKTVEQIVLERGLSRDLFDRIFRVNKKEVVSNKIVANKKTIKNFFQTKEEKETFDKAVKEYKQYSKTKDKETADKIGSRLYRITYDACNSLYKEGELDTGKTKRIFFKDYKDLILELFPESMMFEYNESSTSCVFATTINKLMYPLNPLTKTKKGSLFAKMQDSDKQEISRFVLFMDEFDSQNESILSVIYGRDERRYDNLYMVVSIYDALKHRIPKEGKFACVTEHLQKLLGYYEEKMNEIEFDRSLTLAKGEKVLDRRPVFTSTYVQKESISYNSSVMVLQNAPDHAHELRKGRKEDESQIYFCDYCVVISKMKSKFVNCIELCVNVLMEQDDMRMMEPNAIRKNLLCRMRLLETQRQGMFDNNLKSLRRRTKPEAESSYYEKGFINHSAWKEPDGYNVQIKTSGLMWTPTGYLKALVESGAQIVGVSATAECQTVTKNFDLNYIRKELKESYQPLLPEEKELIYAEYRKRRNYSKVDLNVMFSQQKELNQLVPPHKPIYQLTQEVYGLTEGDNNQYYEQRLRTLLEAIGNFIESDGRYMVCMLNSKVGARQSFKEIKHHLESIFNIYVYEHFDATAIKQGEFDSIKSDLESGNRVVVVTNYKAVGVGASLRYNIPKHELHKYHYVDIKGLEHGLTPKTDIDFMYLECPTHVAALKADKETGCSVHAVHNILSLLESGEICKELAQIELNNVNNHKSRSLSYQKTRDYTAAACKIIEQAIGRTCRTQYKPSVVNLFLDDGACNVLADETKDKSHMTHEYRACVTACQERINPAKEAIIDRVSKNFERNGRDIDKVINALFQPDNERHVKFYERMRRYLLSNPSCYIDGMDKDTIELDEMLMFPCETYFYYCSIISKDNQDAYQYHGYKKQGREFSAISSGLPIFMKNQDIKKHFRKNGYSVIFKKNGDYNHMMNPRAFDIYMGALGEEAFKAIMMEQAADIVSINNMPLALYERFDYELIPHGYDDIVFLVDIKNWKEPKEDKIDPRFFDLKQKVSQKIQDIRDSGHYGDKRVVGIVMNSICNANESSIQFSRITDKGLVECEGEESLSADLVCLSGFIKEDGKLSPTVNALLNFMEIAQ